MWVQIGERIEKMRKDRNLSKTQFGKIIGVSGQYIGQIEKGSGLSVDLIVKICHKMNVSADFILFGMTDSNHNLTLADALQGLSNEQIKITLDIVEKVALFINTEDGNEALIREVASQQRVNIINDE